MERGLLLVLLTGLAWGALGIVMSLRADRKESPLRFLLLSYILGALGVWVFVVDWRALWHTPQPRLLAMSGWALASGALSAAHVIALQAAMRRGNHAVTWACAQSALALSFLASVLLWGERVSLPAWVGLGLVVLALVLLGRPGPDRADVKPGWRFWVAATWLLIGAQQTCASVVSHWEGWQDVGRMRPALAMTATMCVMAVSVLLQRSERGRPWPWRHSAMFGACGAAGFCLMYPALDRLAARGASAIVFPFAVGTSILTVCLWRIRVRGEKGGAAVLWALAVLVVGLLLLAWRTA